MTQHTYTADEVAAMLRCSTWYVLSRSKPRFTRDQGKRRVLAPALVTPIRIGTRPRYTDEDVETLKAALRPDPVDHRRRRRRRTTPTP